MRDARGATAGRPAVCPFVALLEHRDRRADGPDPRNRCYATPAPRQREIAYQVEYCYSERFSTCAAFLDWAARNAAEPSYPVPSIQGAEAARAADERAAATVASGSTSAAPVPSSPDVADGAGSTGIVDARADTGTVQPSGSPTETMDWVSASAWAAYPTAPIEELEEEPDGAADGPELASEDGAAEREEALTAPRVPAALPVRRRGRRIEPIRTRGSGEWFYSDPPDREPLVRRRFSAIPPVVLGVVGLLVTALVVLLIPSLFSGGSDPGTAAAVSPSPVASVGPSPGPTAAPTADGTAAPATPEPRSRPRTYRVRSGDSLSRIAARFEVGMELIQCQNLIRNPDLISVGQVLTIPPDGYACAPGWRRATPTPVPPSPDPTDPTE